MKKRNRQSFGRKVRWQRTYEVSSHPYDVSPYWSWVAQHAPKSDGEYLELPEANPDVLVQDEEYENRRHALSEVITDAAATFSVTEIRVFNWLIQGYTETDIGLKLNVSRSMIQKYRRNIKKKLISGGIKKP